jgi:AraC-like DNA-binding protein
LSNSLASELEPEQILRALRDPFVSKGLALMHRRTSDPWTVETLGRAVGLSRAACAKRVTELCGEPPLSYLTNLRLNRVWLLLRRSHVTVSEACELIGYSNQSAFARAFKRHFGYAPGAVGSIEYTRHDRASEPS